MSQKKNFPSTSIKNRTNPLHDTITSDHHALTFRTMTAQILLVNLFNDDIA